MNSGVFGKVNFSSRYCLVHFRLIIDQQLRLAASVNDDGVSIPTLFVLCFLTISRLNVCLVECKVVGFDIEKNDVVHSLEGFASRPSPVVPDDLISEISIFSASAEYSIAYQFQVVACCWVAV